MKKILVPTDFSKNALKAALYASEIAQRNGAQVHFLHCIEVSELRPPGARGTVYERYANLVMEDAKDELKTFRHAVKRVYKNVSYRTALSGNDSIINAIAKYSLKHEFDLVVMGTRGRKGLAAVFGSVTSTIMSKVPLPILAIPATTEAEKPQDIVLCTEQFEEDHQLLKHVIEMAKIFQTRLHVVSFVERSTEGAGYVEAGRKLAQYAEYLKLNWRDIEVVSELLDGEHFETALEKYCVTHKIGMIAVIPHKRSLLRQITGNSASRKLVLHTDTPLLTLKDRDN